MGEHFLLAPACSTTASASWMCTSFARLLAIKNRPTPKEVGRLVRVNGLPNLTIGIPRGQEQPGNGFIVARHFRIR